MTLTIKPIHALFWLALTLQGLATTSRAAEPPAVPLSIPSEPMRDALTALGRQTGLQVIYTAAEVSESLMSHAIQGTLTPRDALSTMLADSGLTFEYLNDKTIVIHGPRKTSAVLGSDSPAGTSTLEEIVVTAQKRTERLQDVPVSVSTVSAASLEAVHATSLADYAAYVPSLQVTSFQGQPGQVNLSLRGITTGSTAANQSVAIYVDDVPVGSSSIYAGGGSSGVDLTPYDIERIEVLEGPQGTLYGASTLGGLLKYVTREPDLQQMQLRFGADGSAVHNAPQAGYGARANADLPLIPGSLGLSLSLSRTYTPGYINNLPNGQRAFNSGMQDSARAAMLWKPADHLTVDFSALYNRSPFNGAGYIATDSVTGLPVTGRYDNADIEADNNNVSTQLFMGRVRYDMEWAKLTSVSSYSRLTSLSRTDGSSIFFPFLGDYAGFTTRSDVKKFTQEVRLASSGTPRLSWVAGLFFTNETASAGQTGLAYSPDNNQIDPLLSPLIVTDEPSRFREVAGFASATYKILESWDVTAGVRESHNVQTVNESAFGFLFGTDASAPEVTPFPKVSQSKFTYSVSSSFHFSPDQMLYARIATGYRPGGANKIVPDAPATFGPDTTTNYEIGIKTEWLDHRLLVDLTEFYIDWKNTQITGVTPLQLTYLSNAGAAVSKGTELTSRVMPLPGLKLGLNLAYTDAYLTVDAPGLGGVQGDPLPSTPKFSGSLTLNYERALTADYKAQFDSVWRYEGARNTAFPDGFTVGSPNTRLASYSTLDLSAGLSHDWWTARLFVRNATDRYAYLFVVPSGDPTTPSSSVILPPRTIGLSVDVRY